MKTLVKTFLSLFYIACTIFYAVLFLDLFTAMQLNKPFTALFNVKTDETFLVAIIFLFLYSLLSTLVCVRYIFRETK